MLHIGLDLSRGRRVIVYGQPARRQGKLDRRWPFRCERMRTVRATKFSRSLGLAAALACTPAILTTIAPFLAKAEVRGAQAGIRGLVFETQGFAPCQPKPCVNSSPYSATIMVYRVRQNRQLAVIHSNSRGRFHVPLAPGRYLLRPEAQISCAGSVIPVRETIPVRVRRSTYTRVNIQYRFFPVAC